MVNRIVKGFVNGYCKKNNLILLNIHENIFERITDEGNKFNDSYYVIDCMNEENKFLKFKIIETIKSINNELYCEVKAIRI